MGLLLIIAIVLVLYLYSSRSTVPPKSNPYLDEQLSKRNNEWVSFVAGYAAIAKTKTEKQLLLRMLADIKEQGLVNPEYVEELTSGLGDIKKEPANTEKAVAASSIEGVPYTATDSLPNYSAMTQKQPKDALAIKLDNISLLLYFGAFLFVASAGLFVSFADVSGTLRTLMVFFVTIALYGTGVWIFKNKQALKPAGLAFAGIGMSMAPLVGAAAYKYVFTDDAAVVWFATSILCVLLYLHALLVLRKPLVNYIFIFTLLSLFESGVAVVDAPIYYFGWGMALVAIVIQAVGTWKNIWPDFQESSRVSSQLFLPLAVLISLGLVGQQGLGQLGVSLLLAGCFYFLETLRTTETAQQMNAVVSHVSTVAALTCISYALTNNAVSTGGIIVALLVVQTIGVWFSKTASILAYNFASVVMMSGLVGVAFFWQDYPALLIGIVIVIISSLVLWLKQQRADSYVLALIGWLTLPIIYGQLIAEPSLTAATQTWSIVASLIMHELFFIGLIPRHKNGSLRDAARAVLIIHIIVAIVASLLATAPVGLMAIFAIGLIMLPLSVYDDDNIWSILSGGVVALSVVRCWGELRLLPIALFVSLAYNILLALRFRSEPNRWLSSLLWLLMPIGLGMSNEWASEQYAWFYIVVMVALVISRAIARGVAFTSARIPIAAYAKSASLSYVFGYVSAGALALAISLGSSNGQLHTSLILGFLSLTTFVVAWGVEKRSDLIALQPAIWQLLLLSIVRPDTSSGIFEGYILLSTLLAAFCYGVSGMLLVDKKYKNRISREAIQVSILTAFIAPASILLASSTVWSMPLGLGIAGLILLDYWRNFDQQYKELACGIIVAAILWSMQYFGVTEFQAYTHVLALMFAGFAYWRSLKNDRAQSDNYLYIMLSVATVPLVLQALSGEAGGLYGWWLLLEQVVFMMLGIVIRRKFVTMWGLYVAIGSVLYQLRNLGWAALSVLALFIIGVAVYQLQKYNKPDQ